MREHVLSGEFNTAEAEREIGDEVAGRAMLCPRCAARQVAHRRTGLCRVCNAKALAEHHREAIALIEARRECTALRQEKHRIRGKAGRQNGRSE